MILIIDDDIAIRTSLSVLLKRAKYEVETAAKPREAIAIVREQAPQLILMDMNYSRSTDGQEGLTLLKQVKLFRPETPIILMTAWGSINLAVAGMKAGAFDFITKPWHNVDLLERVETALSLTPSQPSPRASSLPNAPSPQEEDLGGFIIGHSPALMEILHTVRRVAPTSASVLITGESGTGKELIAEAVHRLSRRADKPFVKVNLGGISQSLFESEMFGHKKGAFTDAFADRKGRFAMADGGTIFLDEIGDLDLGSQVKLLRVLQDHTYEVLGDSHSQHTDVRVVAATNADLKQRMADHTFREDLFYRINLIHLHLPPLRERREDIPLLVEHFARRFAEENGLPQQTFSPETMQQLEQLPYPGNVRELKTVVERLMLTGEIPAEAEETGKEEALASLADIDREAIIAAMKANDNKIARAAKALGISRQALYRKLEKLHLS